MKMRTVILLAAIACSACASHAESVCENIGNCTTQSSDQIQACQKQVKQLAKEAAASGCSSQYEGYFSCADERFACKGNVPTFLGCESARASLDSCLEGARASTSCGQLSAKLSLCPGDLPAPAPSMPPSPCGEAEVCSSRCYLDFVSEVCRPEPLQLSQAAKCAQQCPP
jgi:hypothetical protein